MVLVGPAALACGAGARDTAPPAPAVVAPVVCRAGELADSLAPSRDGFFREALFAAPTGRTPRFDDYTPGSYHPAKLDVLAGLPAAAAACGVRLEGLLVLGPVGPLWAYHVAVLVPDGDSVRVTTLVMPHARITGKGAGRIGRAAVDSFYREVAGSPLVRPGPAPTPDETVRRDVDVEWRYDLLLARFAAGGQRTWHASVRDAAQGGGDRASLVAAINGLLGATDDTYPVGRSQER